MSIKVMTRVWEHSEQNNGKLLLLLALADHADDSGVCWPGIAKLAGKARIQPRQAKRHLRELEASGELFILPQKGMPGGRGYTNLYFVTVALSADEIAKVLVDRFEFEPKEAEKMAKKLKGGESDTHKKGVIQGQKGVIQGQKGVIQGQKRVSSTPPEPSVNRQGTVKEPSGDGDEKKSPVPPSHDPSFLPEAEQQIGLLFPQNGQGIEDCLKLITRSGWDRKLKGDILHATAHCLKATGLPIPNDPSTRGDWQKAVKQHIANYGIDLLGDLYPETVTYMRGEKLSISGPWSLTKSLVIVATGRNSNAPSPHNYDPLTPSFLEDTER